MQSPTPEPEYQVIDLTPGAAVVAGASVNDSHRTCKFILFRHRNVVTLVYGDISAYRYHANLLDQFCRSHGVEASWVHRPDMLEVLDLSVNVIGGGILELDAAAHTVRFSGASKAYGPCSRRRLESVIESSSSFAGLKVTIDP